MTMRRLKRPRLPALPLITLCELEHAPSRLPSPAMRVRTALQRLERVWGTDVSGWHSSLITPGKAPAVAWIGPRHHVVAVASHAELDVSLRILAWEIDDLCHVS